MVSLGETVIRRMVIRRGVPDAGSGTAFAFCHLKRNPGLTLNS
jgi:hypothetical protein